MRNDLECILCRSTQLDPYHRDENRSYIKCRSCKLVFVPAKDRLSPEEEKKRYDLHENDPADEHYRQFLGRLFNPLMEVLEEDSYGLDFGSGPGPTLIKMFEEKGHTMKLYDPFYADHPEVFTHTYDFITATEVVEHLHNPGRELNRLWECIKKDGYLGIMTKRAGSREEFVDWHYIRDETHVAFYGEQTFKWLSDHWNAQLQLKRDDVAIFKK